MMKKNNSIFIQSIVCVAFILSAFVCFFIFQKPEKNICLSGNLNIAVIDAELLKSSAVCFKSHENVAEMLNKVIEKMKISETDIKSEYEKVKSNSKLNEQQKQTQIFKIENKWSEISSQYNSEIQNIRNIDYKLSEKLEKELNNVIEEVSKKMKLNLVLNKEMKDSVVVFYNSKNLDITKIVAEKLNKKIPSSNIKDILK